MKTPGDYPENPTLLAYRRAGLTESVHRGAYVLLRGPSVLESRGVIEHPYFLRSCAKPLQMLPLLELGGEERFGLVDEEIALIAASHNGEDTHREAAASILKKGGLAEADLRCGAHAPFDGETAARLRAAGSKTEPLRHNCSGKHAGMLLLAKMLGQDTKTYLDPKGAVQTKIRERLAQLCRVEPQAIPLGTDGCSAPTFALSLKALATGFARFGNPRELTPETAQACARIHMAIAAAPYHLAGRKQLDTDLAKASGGRIVGKRGAEGVYALTVIGEDVGLALKIDDGSNRMHGFLILSILNRHGLLRDTEAKALGSYLDAKQKNYSGLEVGDLVEMPR